jgi:serine phosphatase RsbU (regulator of sigma subunit)
MKLLVAPAEGDPFELELNDGSMVVGRSSTAHLPLADPYASRHHARLTIRGESLLVEDLGSRNRTFVNDQPVVGRVEVHPGDVIKIASSTLRREGEAELLSDAMTRAPESSTALDSTAVRMAVTQTEGESSDSIAKIRDGEALDRYANRLRTLRQIHRGYSRATTRAELLRVVLDSMFRYFAADQGAIYLRGPQGELRKEDSRPLDGPGIPLPEQTVARVLHEEVAIATRVESAQQMGEPSVAQPYFLMAAPLLEGGVSFGMLVLSTTRPLRGGAEEEIDLLAELAREAALEIKRMGLVEEAAQRRLLQLELDLARRIQLGILPDKTPSFAGYSFLTRNLPSRGVSGDLYALSLRRGGDECVLILGDVSGKGFAAALVTASVEAFSTVMVEAGYAPDEICTRLSRQLFERTLPSGFVTAFVGALDRESGRLTYTNAGDNAALLAQPDGSLARLSSLGLPLALMKDSVYESRQVVMAPGATLLLYTDGIIEARDRADQEYGLARLEDRFLGNRNATLGEIFAAIHDDVESFTGGVPYADDRTIVLVRRSAAGAG